jgi:hypothetical protein
MSLLTVKYKREGYKLAGTSLPLPAHNYLALHTLAKGTTKSKIITNLINNWMSKQREKEPVGKLIQDIIARVQTQWRIKKTVDAELTFAGYKEQIAFELEKKGLLADQIDMVLRGLKEKEK